MSETKWTKGPWWAEFSDYGGYDCMWAAWYVKAPTKPFSLATLECNASHIEKHDNDPEQEANARLISAAPELYESLEGAQEELRLIRMKDCDAVYDPTIRVRIQLALAKARGEAVKS